MACVGTSPHAARVVRAAKRLADGLGAPWMAVYVETPTEAGLEEAERARVADTLLIAERLGAETVALTGERASDVILAYARQRHVTRLVIGKANQPAWKRLFVTPLTERLIRHGGGIDVCVIGEEAELRPPWIRWGKGRSAPLGEYLRALAIVALCTAGAWLVFPYFELSNLIMIYLLGVVGVAMRSATGPSLLASALSVAAFDFFFVHPYLTFAVTDAQYVVTFAVMFIVALVISGSTIRIRRLADSARRRERRTAAVYALSRELASAQDIPRILRAAAGHIAAVFRSRITVWLPDDTGRLRPQPDPEAPPELPAEELEAAARAFAQGHLSTRGPVSGEGVQTLYAPLRAPRGTLGVLRLEPEGSDLARSPEELHHLETFTNQTALALERAALADEARMAQVRAETERMRSSLLSSVSHDLRTPLSVITGAASSLLYGQVSLAGPAARELLQTVHEEGDRLNRLVQNLLQMTRLESGALQVHKEWFPLEEVVGAALGRLAPQLRDRSVTTRIPEAPALVPMDDVLIEQVLINLLDNALKHAPSATPIEISAAGGANEVSIEVADRGPGLRPGEAARVFEKFYRGSPGASRGAGLGLAICRGIVEAHGGRIEALNRPEGGAVFRFTLPIGENPPTVTRDEE
jgi:two-component system sensor histidine kinase KdpD